MSFVPSNINPATSVSLHTVGKRNYGIDFLRIISMLMVLVLHILGAGGFLKNATPLTASFEVGWFMEICAYCAVNCYAIISGYVGINSKFKYSGIVTLWLQVAFYSVLFTLMAAILLPYIGKAEVLTAFLPVTKKFFWYFTAYFCIYFFTPLFNKIIHSFTENQLKITALTIFIIFSVLPTFSKTDLFFTNKGYSSIWLALLYILGGIIKKCNILEKLKIYQLILLYFAMAIITWVEKYVTDCHNLVTEGEKWKNIFVQYTSPTILLCAVFLVVAFSKINVGKAAAKIIGFFAPLAFGVYIIHLQRFANQFFIKDKFIWLTRLKPVVLFFTVIGIALAIFLVCSFIDALRAKLFKLLKIKETLIKLETKFLKNIWS